MGRITRFWVLKWKLPFKFVLELVNIVRSEFLNDWVTESTTNNMIEDLQEFVKLLM